VGRPPKVSLMMWRWSQNSCAFDAVLITFLIGLQMGRRFPAAVPVERSLSRTRFSLPTPQESLVAVLGIAERMIGLWQRTPDHLARQLGEARDDFRRVIAPHLRRRGGDPMTDECSVSEIMQILCSLVCSETLSPDKIEGPIVAPGFAKNADITCPDAFRGFPASSPFVFIEAAVFHQRSLVHNFGAFDDLAFPDSLELPIGRFDFLSCIETNGGHFRARVAVSEAAAANVNGIASGMYLFDPMQASHPVVRTGETLRDNSGNVKRTLREALPKFATAGKENGGFYPHFFVYVRTG